MTSDSVDTEKQIVDSPAGPESPSPADNKTTPTGHLYDVPDGGYGWVVVFVVFVSCMSTWGVNSAYGIYLADYVNNDVFPGARNIDFAVIGGIAFCIGMLFLPIINYLLMRYSINIVVFAGGLFQLAASLLALWSTKLWQLYLTQGLLQLFGLSVVAIPVLGLVPQWFRQKRLLAQGIASAGSSVGGLLFLLSMQRILQQYSFRWALRAQAIMAFCLTTVGSVLVRTRSTHIKPSIKLFDSMVFLTFGFWTMAAWYVFTMLGYGVLNYNIADYVILLGYTPHQGSVVTACVQIGNLVGRPLAGLLSDKIGPVTVALVAHFLAAFWVLAFGIPLRNYAGAICFGLLVGLCMGIIWPTMAPIATRVVGLPKLGVTLGAAWIFIGLPSLASPVIGLATRGDPPAGKLHDPTQYTYPFVFTGLSYFCAAVSLWVLRGWLVARDQLAHSGSESDNGLELAIRVPAGKAVQGLWQRGSRPV